METKNRTIFNKYCIEAVTALPTIHNLLKELHEILMNVYIFVLTNIILKWMKSLPIAGVQMIFPVVTVFHIVSVLTTSKINLGQVDTHCLIVTLFFLKSKLE